MLPNTCLSFWIPLWDRLLVNGDLSVVDDCSTDDSWNILTSYAAKDDRITIHRLDKNSGSAKFPRDTAVSKADTDWVCAIDADDYIEPDYIKKLHERQRETGAEIVTVE